MQACLYGSLIYIFPLFPYQATVTEEDKERLIMDLQKKLMTLERRLQGNLTQDEHLQELLQEVNICINIYINMIITLKPWMGG